MATAIAEPPAPTTPAPTPAIPPPDPSANNAPTPPEQKPEPKDNLRDTLKDSAFWDDFPHGRKKVKAKDDAAPDPDAPASPEKPAAAAPAATPDAPATPTAPAATPKKPKAVKRPEIDHEKLVAVATEAATKAALDARPAQPVAAAIPATQPQDAISLIALLPDELQADGDVYAEMQRVFPDKHGKILIELVDYSRKEEEYSKKWQREHPQEDFDPDDSKHDDFYEDNKPKFSKRDFKEAERALIRRQAREEIRSELQPQLDSIEMQRKQQSIAPEIVSLSKSVLKSALAGVNKDYEKLADNQADLVKLPETDPIAADVVGMVMGNYHPLIEESTKLFSGAAKFNRENPRHMQLFELAEYVESEIAKLPSEDRMHEGKLFATREEWSRLTDAQREKRWMLDNEKMVQVIAGKAQTDAEKIYAREQERLERYDKARGLKTDSSVTGANGRHQSNGALAPEPKPIPAVQTPTPTVTGKTTLSNDRPVAGGGGPSWRDSFGFGARGK